MAAGSSRASGRRRADVDGAGRVRRATPGTPGQARRVALRRQSRRWRRWRARRVRAAEEGTGADGPVEVVTRHGGEGAQRTARGAATAAGAFAVHGTTLERVSAMGGCMTGVMPVAQVMRERVSMTRGCAMSEMLATWSVTRGVGTTSADVRRSRVRATDVGATMSRREIVRGWRARSRSGARVSGMRTTTRRSRVSASGIAPQRNVRVRASGIAPLWNVRQQPRRRVRERCCSRRCWRCRSPRREAMGCRRDCRQGTAARRRDRCRWGMAARRGGRLLARVQRHRGGVPYGGCGYVPYGACGVPCTPATPCALHRG
jgi:hypothetical protein